ncbi:hypothetical protein DZ860_20985 [Vibrio sinensis]|uniref:Uncharacterized protein n=1 Tax=Vibrio sinensis TaxID=2302434 RepID=A0A3A6Q8C7_9VIBR|nr:hypothetical protein [Vibrio sinensis]RJX65838.1 hypothetical protein DZ860_20985 [Vibrio sinensis]
MNRRIKPLSLVATFIDSSTTILQLSNTPQRLARVVEAAAFLDSLKVNRFFQEKNMNTLDIVSSQQLATKLSGTLALPPSARRQYVKAPMKNWRARIHYEIRQYRVSKKTSTIIIISSKKHCTAFYAHASVLHCPHARCNVTKALLLADKIDRKNDPLRTLGYTPKRDKHAVFLEVLYR